MAGFDVIRKQLEEERRRNAAPAPTQPAPTVQAPAAAPSANVTQKAANPIDPFNIRYAGPEPEPEKMPEWETARQNPTLLNSIKRYAKNVAGENFADDQAAFDWYVGDRRWKDANVGSMIKELNFVKGGFGVKEPTIQDLEDLQVMRTEWDKLPGGIERIAKGDVLGGTGAILENIAKGLVDPTILLGGIFGKAAGSLVGQGTKEVTKQGIKRALQTGTAITTDFGIGAGASTIYQETNVELGLQNEVSGWEALKAGGLGALLSTPGAIGAFSPKKAAEVVDPELAAQQAISGASELRKRGIRSFSEGSGKTPSGLKLTQEDVELVQKNQNTPVQTILREQVKPTQQINLKLVVDEVEELVPGQTGRFHGTSRPIDKLEEGHYDTFNIYGQGFYTTDDLSIARGYTKKGKGGQPTYYTVKENFPDLKFLDMELEVPDFLKNTILKDPDNPMDEFAAGIYEYLEQDGPVSLRALYDAMRDQSSGEGISADSLQELFEGFADLARANGFAGYSHVGGKFTGNAPHNVKIYFNPERDVTITQYTPQTIKKGRLRSIVPADKSIVWPPGKAEVKQSKLYATKEEAEQAAANFRRTSHEGGIELIGETDPEKRFATRFKEVVTESLPEQKISQEELAQAADFLEKDIRFAQVLREALPHLESPGDFFKFVGQNAPKLREWKLRNTNSIVDEGDFPRMLRSMQQEFEDQFQTARRGVVSDKQTMREAKNLAKGKTPEQMVQEVTTPIPGYVGNASEQTYRRMVIAMMEDDLTQAADNILKLGRDLTEDEIRDFERKHELMGAALANFGGMRSETGRALRVSPVNRTEQLMGKVATTANKLVGTNLSTQERSRLLTDIAKGMKMLDKGDDLQLELFVANLNSGPGTLSEKFYEMWYNWGLLSNPSTVVINSLGGMASGGLNIAEKAVGAAFHSSERAPFVARLAGYFTSIPEALKVGFKTYMSEVPIDTQTRLENSRSYALGSWKLTDKGWRKAGVGESGLIIGGRQARIPGRMLMGTDDMLKFSHQRAYIHSEAVRASVQAGKAGDAKFLKDYEANVPPEVLNAAEEEARRLTYTDRLGSTMRNFQQFVHDLPGGRLIFPFIRTPTKIIQQAADMLSVPGTPFTTSRTAADLAAGGARKTEALARVGIGYSLLGTGAWMAANGLMTGAAPKDEGARRTFELNKLPWAAKIDNIWVQFNRFDPLAIPLTIGVGIEKTFEAFAASGTGLEREDAFMTTMTAMLSDALLDKSFFQGVENVVTAITEPERKLQSFGKGVVRSFVPAVTAGFARAVDPRTTAPVTFWEVIQDRIGFDAREKVPTAVNALGYEVPNEVYGSTEGETGIIHTINRWVQPFRARSGADDPLLNEIYDLGVSLNPRRKKWKNVDLDSRQQHAYAKAEGRTLRDTLRFVTSQPGWKDMPKETKRLFIEKAKDNAAKMGQLIMLATYPELYKQDMEANRTVEKLVAPTRGEVKEKIAPRNVLDIFKKSGLEQSTQPTIRFEPEASTLKQEASAFQPRKSVAKFFNEDYSPGFVDGRRVMKNKPVPASTVISALMQEPSTPEAGKLASKLQDILANSRDVSMTVVKPPRGTFTVRGTTSTETGEIDIYTPSDSFTELELRGGAKLTREQVEGRNEETVLHETVHAVLVNMINARGFDAGDKKEIREALPELYTIYNEWANQRSTTKALRDATDTEGLHISSSFRSLHEFAAYALTSPEMQQHLKEMPYKGKYRTKEQRIEDTNREFERVAVEMSGSMWDKFVFAVSDTLGLGRDERDLTYLDAVLDASNSVFERARYRTIYKKGKK